MEEQRLPSEVQKRTVLGELDGLSVQILEAKKRVLGEEPIEDEAKRPPSSSIDAIILRITDLISIMVRVNKELSLIK